MDTVNVVSMLWLSSVMECSVEEEAVRSVSEWESVTADAGEIIN